VALKAFRARVPGNEETTMKLHRAIDFLAFGLLLLMIPAALSTPSSAEVGVGISVRVGPPALPVYAQPICPGPGYLWTPGYWAWSNNEGYYWVPGTWVVAPVGMLWTPGYWGRNGGVYAWHAGYWGPHIGFYGGVNYGFGYGGVGFAGGEWRHGAFFYNTAVMHVDSVHVRNVYVNRTVVVRNESHVAFNGEGGVRARPSREEESYAREPHRTALAEQTRHEHAASRNHELFASANHGRPAVAATGRPGEFKGHHVVAAKSAGAPYHAPRVSSKEARAPAVEAKHPASNVSHSANRPSALPSKSNSSHAVIAPRPVSAHPKNQPHVQPAPKAGPAPARAKSAPRATNHENKR
jgi:WXXGXW repeat (2 copies)